MLAHIPRYFAALVGPAASAGAQFLLSLILLHHLQPREFGVFSLLLLVSQLSWGLWSALFCAPLPVITYGDRPELRERLIAALFSTSLAAAAVAIPLFGLLAWVLQASVEGAIIFGVYGGVALLRWFARAYAYVTGAAVRTIASDLGYAAVLILGSGALFFLRNASLDLAYGLLLLSAVVGMLPFGLSYLKRQFGSLSIAGMGTYASIWKRHSGWSLLGVVTTEATANSHAYIVTASLGAAQFAPVAASTLLIRPISVVMNALGEWERPRIAAAIANGRMEDVRRSVRHFRLALLAAWIATLAAAIAILLLAPHLIFPPEYDLRFVTAGGALFMLVALVRLLRAPESTVLQASGEFRGLAFVTVFSAVVSLVAVTLLLWLGGVLWSIVGILIGELLCAVLTWRLSAGLRARNFGAAGRNSSQGVGWGEMKLTIGIKALNEEEHIGHCLESAVAAVQKLGGEVVLADSGSTDATIDIARRHDVRIVQIARVAERSCGAGAQLAFQFARGEYFYLIDGDMIVRDGFVETAIDYLERHPDVAAVGGRIVERNLLNEEFKIRNASLSEPRKPEEAVDRLDGGGVYRMSALRQVSYFADRNLHSFEEFELGARLRTAGWRLVRLSQPAVDHYGHRMGGYKLLLRRIKGGYANGIGEVVRSAIGTPHMNKVVLGLSQVRHATFVLVWWLLILGCLVTSFPIALAVLIAAPVIFLSMRRGSLPLGLYSYVAWNVNAFGLIAGLLQRRTTPNAPIEAIEIRP